uniref:Ribosome biogenesis protein BRX1 homolog n=1 Tax=Propithecus coquereli TaxID=379532 RepID=A0A2K6F999_PROCO
MHLRNKREGEIALQAKWPKEREEVEEEERDPIPSPFCKGRWKNKEKILIFSSRGINFRTRHLMKDLRMLMPHSKTDTKIDRKDRLFVINEVCEMKNCNKSKKKEDLYMWLSNSPHGPSAKFLVQNIHTLAELRMTGNYLKELLIWIFSIPQYHLKSQPFVDHMFTFIILDNRIWFWNFQIIEDAALREIGPRFVLNLIKIIQGSFGGRTLCENPHYQSPIISITAAKYKEKQQMKEVHKLRKREPETLVPHDPTADGFVIPAEEKPIEIQKKRIYKRQRKMKQDGHWESKAN